MRIHWVIAAGLRDRAAFGAPFRRASTRSSRGRFRGTLGATACARKAAKSRRGRIARKTTALHRRPQSRILSVCCVFYYVDTVPRDGRRRTIPTCRPV
eukprot:scaffold90498_cov32-Tisochrysis_lutea.AAC.5